MTYWHMAAVSPLTVLEQSQVSPPPSTTTTGGNRSLPLTFFDMFWLTIPGPVHTLFFYDLPITQTHFTQTTIPTLQHSLSITLQHFFPFAGKLTIFPTTPTTKPQITYVQGRDSVAVTFAESNLDFNHLTGYHPRDCYKFYHLIPLLGPTVKVSDHITIPVFSVQVTLFPGHGISIGMTNHHSLGDASTRFCFLKAWTSIARSGSDESFLANGTFPVYDRLAKLAKYSELDEVYLKRAKVELFNEAYQLPRLCPPSDRVRATFILARTAIDGLKKLVSTHLPSLAYVSSFTVACAFIWHCVARLYDEKRSVLFAFPINCRRRMDPPVPDAYFGNCVIPCITLPRADISKGKEGFLKAAELIGENLHKMLTVEDGVVKDFGAMEDLVPDWVTTFMGVSGTPKLKFYDLDFGFGRPRKHETVSIDYSGSISVSACRDCSEDLEIGVSFTSTEMDVFSRNFNEGLETYV